MATYAAKDFRSEMTKDSNFPVSRHAGKVIEVTGVLEAFGSGPNTGLLLGVGPNKLLDVMTFKVSDQHPWGKVLPTQSVTLRMLTPNTTNDPNPFVWQIVEVKGPPPAPFTAEGLIKERSANVKAFDQRYDNALVVVTGTVVAEPPAISSAALPAAVAMSLVTMPSGATRRSLMPVRSVIHVI